MPIRITSPPSEAYLKAIRAGSSAPQIIEKVIEKRIEIPVPVEVRVEVPVEKLVEIPVERIVHVEKQVEIPVYIKETVEVTRIESLSSKQIIGELWKRLKAWVARGFKHGS